jgi:hypothetical protein
MTVENGHTEAPRDETSGRTEEGSKASRRNALRGGRRSRVVFPPEMEEEIRERTRKLIEQMKLKTEVERTLARMIARTGVQAETAADKLLTDAQRVIESVDITWDADRRTQVNNLARRLPGDPIRVSQLLLKTKHGTELCLERWRGLESSIVSNGGLTEEQRQMAFDMLGVNPILRDNTSKVPAGDNAGGLLAMVDREVKRLQGTLEGELEESDQLEREYAQRGLPIHVDSITRNLKSDRSRADKLLAWAFDALQKVRAGLPPSTIINPETRQPMAPEGSAPAQDGTGPQDSPAAAAAPPPPPPDSPSPYPSGSPSDDPPAPPDDGPIPIPPEITGEDREMLLMVGELLRSQLLMAGRTPPGPRE